ncbi:LOW QUALITY PROTEIN: hypothetical protein Cgig2_012988 [Carnegiea gigantea]|uniref:Ribosomal protein L2 n=1 Tax=Carnegiea gigantea TaxID=171969 RepID=A0A9Q1K9W5_9CARY|nr:LOW QUALITY PROTEIN: hypothetical protein Cgig2_012988 [Carnegiea gigantea]
MLQPHCARPQSAVTCKELIEEGSRTPQPASCCEELGAEPVEQETCASTRLCCTSSWTFSPSTATCLAVASPDSRGDNFAFTCSAQDKKESEPTAPMLEKHLIPLEKSLRISRPATAKLLLGIHHLGHEFRYRPRTVVLPDVEIKVTGRPFVILSQLLIGILDRVSFIPMGKIPPTCVPVYEKKVIFLILNLGLLLDSRHKTLLVVRTMPPDVLSLLRGPLDRMGLRKCAACADVRDHGVERKPYTISKGRSIHCYAFGGRLTHGSIRFRKYKPISGRQETRGSYVNLPRVKNLLLNIENARGGRILAARPRGGAGLKYRHRIGNLFGLPKLIL